jgi:hypothetical protein
MRYLNPTAVYANIARAKILVAAILMQPQIHPIAEAGRLRVLDQGTFSRNRPPDFLTADQVPSGNTRRNQRAAPAAVQQNA